MNNGKDLFFIYFDVKMEEDLKNNAIKFVKWKMAFGKLVEIKRLIMTFKFCRSDITVQRNGKDEESGVKGPRFYADWIIFVFIF